MSVTRIHVLAVRPLRNEFSYNSKSSAVMYRYHINCSWQCAELKPMSNLLVFRAIASLVAKILLLLHEPRLASG